MTSLSLIETEAHRLIGRIPESRRLAQQTALLELCEAHWHSLRGPQPDTPLAQTLWSVTPPLADLLLDLYAGGDSRLDEILSRNYLARGLAFVVFAYSDSLPLSMLLYLILAKKA